MKQLRDLPNKVGFRFIGITHSDDAVECIVDKNHMGLHSVYQAYTNIPCYHDLKGWKEKDGQ